MHGKDERPLTRSETLPIKIISPRKINPLFLMNKFIDKQIIGNKLTVLAPAWTLANKWTKKNLFFAALWTIGYKENMVSHAVSRVWPSDLKYRENPGDHGLKTPILNHNLLRPCKAMLRSGWWWGRHSLKPARVQRAKRWPVVMPSSNVTFMTPLIKVTAFHIK